MFFDFETENPQVQTTTTQYQTETVAFSDSQFDFKLPIVDLDQQVEDIRKRAEIILEKLLALPDPPKKESKTPNSSPVSSPKKKEEVVAKNNSPKAATEDAHSIIPSPKQSRRESPTNTTRSVKKKAKKSVKKKPPQYIIPKREPIVIPGANERYDQQLELLQQQLQRLNSENSHLQSLVRVYKMKLRESQIEEGKLKYALQQSQRQRRHVDPDAEISPSSINKK